MKLDENKMECPVCGTYMVKCGQCEYMHFICPNHEVSCMAPVEMFKSTKYNKEVKQNDKRKNTRNHMARRRS